MFDKTMLPKHIKKEYKEQLLHAVKVLDEYGLEYEYSPDVYALYIQHPTQDWIAYDYRFTSNRWGSLVNRRNKLRKHYRCRSIEELITKYILVVDDKPISREDYIKKAEADPSVIVYTDEDEEYSDGYLTSDELLYDLHSKG
tara:strand:- start:19 stop:444 length:426 start_codon:yes stop_codon:yes gene_type:complete